MLGKHVVPVGAAVMYDGSFNGQNRRKRPRLPVAVIVAETTYDPVTGEVTGWHRPRHGEGWAIRPNLQPNGYLRLRVFGPDRSLHLVLAHHVAVVHMTGAWPSGVVDHVNGQVGDNRWANLRDVSHSENMRNRIAWGGWPLSSKPRSAPAPRKRKVSKGWREFSAEWWCERLSYDPVSGQLMIWRDGQAVVGGRPSGHPPGVGWWAAFSVQPNGYLATMVTVDGCVTVIKAHHAAFVCMTGAFPVGVVDHVNRDRGDNRWANLRDVSRSENNHNRAGTAAVQLFHKGGKRFWRVCIRKGGQQFTATRRDFCQLVRARAALVAQTTARADWRCHPALLAGRSS